ncbi:MAG: hypothetical protein Q8O37_16025 [Sulfuricellaceae bacterium]|nr:hypothetical protein [Sulfuricellaceae bacterium]
MAAAAIRAADRAQIGLAARTVDLTDGEVTAATQRDKLLAHILSTHGIELPDMRASTLENLLESGYHGASGDLSGTLIAWWYTRITSARVLGALPFSSNSGGMMPRSNRASTRAA